LDENMKTLSARRYALAILFAAGLLAAPQAANAAPPKVSGPPDDLHLVLPAGTACAGFELHADGTDSQVRTTTFTNNAGVVLRTFSSGKGYNLTYTNPDNNATVSFPSTEITEDTIFHKDGTRTVTNTGQFGIIMFPTDIPAGPSTTQYNGRVVYTADAANNFEILKTKATQIDVCDALS
jgi:opacity protein-like surface antigen